jgi:hypothetical protein
MDSSGDIGGNLQLALNSDKLHFIRPHRRTHPIRQAVAVH